MELFDWYTLLSDWVGSSSSFSIFESSRGLFYFSRHKPSILLEVISKAVRSRDVKGSNSHLDTLLQEGSASLLKLNLMCLTSELLWLSLST